MGPSKTAYSVHQEVLCKSPVFKALCSSGLKESQTRLIELPEDDPAAIGLLINVLEIGHYLPCGPVSEEWTKLLAKLYIAADKYMVEGIKEVIINDLKSERCLPSLTDDGFLELSEHVYRSIPELDKPFRELFIDMACNRFDDHDFFFHAHNHLASTPDVFEDLFEAQNRAWMASEDKHEIRHRIARRQLDRCMQGTCHR